MHSHPPIVSNLLLYRRSKITTVPSSSMLLTLEPTTIGTAVATIALRLCILLADYWLTSSTELFEQMLRGYAYRKLGHFGKAVDDYAHSLELDADNVKTLNNRG
jgi:hypothetical protein